MNAEKFWYSWLKVTMIIVIIAGIAIAFLSHTPLFESINKSINHVFFSDQLPDYATQMLQGWLLGVMGAILTAWGITVLYLTCNAMKKKEFWAWKCIFYSLIAWFIIDTSVSIYYQAILNVFINCIFLFQIVAPLLFLRNSFKQNTQVVI